MKLVLIFLLFMSCTSCTHNGATPVELTNQSLHFSILQAAFPLSLSNINFNNTNASIELNDLINAKISACVHEFYNKECLVENAQDYSIQDCYIKTILLEEKHYYVFVILLKSFPTHELKSKILFYQKQSKSFIEDTFDFKTYALYDDYENGKLIPSNLKKELNILNPEIELMSINQDEAPIFKFTRLFHNGSFNAIETTILKIENNKINIISSYQKGIGPLSPK